ncbi:MAG TPA: hypothetical protein PLL99_07460, partial [Chitinophagales bacterium]|nr:hypothetical protein [Chitinophagales bacterium]
GCVSCILLVQLSINMLLLPNNPKKVNKYRTKDEAIKALAKKAKANISKKYLKGFLSDCNI